MTQTAKDLSTSGVPTLDYTDQPAASSAVWWWRAALVFALLPMVAGTGVTIAYAFTFNSVFEDAGFLILFLAGPLSVGLAIAFMVVFSVTASRAGLSSGVMGWRIVAIVSAVLMNFPVAVVCFGAGTSLMGSIRLHVTNESSQPLQDVRFHVIGTSWPVGDLGPGESWSTWTTLPSGDGQISIEWVSPAGRQRSVGSEYESGTPSRHHWDVQLNEADATWK